MRSLSVRFRLLGRPEERRGVFVATAQDLVLGGVCYLKFCPSGSDGAAALDAEAQLLADLSHPRLVRLTGRFDGVLEPSRQARVRGFSTAWVDGEPLIAACADFPQEERLALFAGLLQVVGYLHHRRVLHLDLKPQNVLAAREMGVVLLDLGSACNIDAAPGTAGGTLGYAAPEVLAGQAASVASDIYSLGAILYELLTGLRPHGDLDVRELRRACLAGDIIPIRVVRKDVPRQLAQLTQEMLALQPATRPRAVDEVIDRLRSLGFPIPRAEIGAPPFAARERDIEALGAMLRERRGTAIAVVGRRGSGRSRLIRAVLQREQPGSGITAIDLSDAERPFLAVQRLLANGSHELPAAGTPEFVPALRERLRSPIGREGVVFLGRLEDMGPGEREELSRLLPELNRSGFSFIVASERIPPGCRALPMGALPDEAMEAIGQFAGVHPGPELRRAIERSAGNPGALLRQIAGGGDPSTLPPELRVAYEALASLPSGLTPTVLGALPTTVRDRLNTLLLFGFAWRDAEGLIQLDIARADLGIHELLRPAIERLLREQPCGLDPLWRLLARVRLGQLRVTEAELLDAEAAVGNRHGELEEALVRVSRANMRAATLMLARLRLNNANIPGTLEALTFLGEDDAAAAELRIRALRLDGQLDVSERAARAALDRLVSPGIWLELALCLCRRDALAEASEAVERALALDPTLANGEGLAAQLLIASRQQALGHEAPALVQLLDRVEALAVTSSLPASMLSHAGRALTSLGFIARGEAMLERATATADREGDLRLSAVTRLNRGVALQGMGRGREARQAFSEALLIVRATGQSELLLRLAYSLAFLELRSGRLPAAEAYVAEFNEVSHRLGDRQSAQRGQVLTARLELLRERPHRVVALLEAMDTSAMPKELAMERAFALARAQLDIGHPVAALAVLDDAPAPVLPSDMREVQSLRGRALLASGRAQLALAKAAIPEKFDSSEHADVGEILLAHAGEDLDPATFGERRRDLDSAARFLRGQAASRAATLRDRLLEGPGAALEGIVELIEAMNTPQAFPAAIARLVTEALGANRVLIMVRMPGLGQQMTYKELAGEEAAGIGKEVMSRITGPGDVWLARDAFADPALREASATVRTFEIKSLLAVAIPYENRAIGAFYVDDLHRSDRFGEMDVRVLKRLAAAAGRMIALLPSANQRHRPLLEPEDVLGVLLSDPNQIAALRDAAGFLQDQRASNLLVSGPTGVGKTWFARRVATDVLGLNGLEEIAVHQGDPQFLVGMLGGTRKGEFSGALDKSGAIQRAIAERKALFIDEIQALSDPGQQALLPLLELPHRRFGRLMGSTEPIHGSLHIILGTNVEVAGKRWAEHFRHDLWYRMSEVHVALPSLAERGSEVIYLYLAGMLKAAGDGPPEEVFDIAALQRITTWIWTGNLRQLQSFAAQAVHLHLRIRQGRPIPLSELHRLGLRDEDPELDPEPSGASMMARERELIVSALRRAGWVQAEAARLLGISRWKMLRLVRKHDLEGLIRARRAGA